MKQIALSFCIPIMNRLSDIQATLRRNLDDNRDDQDRVEFIVVCFDQDTATKDWIEANFAEDLSTRYLRFYQTDSMKTWHFGRAKNSFRQLIYGKIYASLDGDNFTGRNGGRHIINTFAENDFNCVFHQFQGDWGDGTCGRVSMTAQDYMEIGYDDNFLPRQWDELDAILTILVTRPGRRYVCYSGKSIIQKSHPFKRFVTDNAIDVETVEIDGSTDPLYSSSTDVAVGRHKSTYVQDDARLRYSSIFNHLSSFFKNTKDSNLKVKYVSELVDTQRAMAEEINPGQLVDWFLVPQQAGHPELSGNDIVLVACIRNEPRIDEWLKYYKELGVTQFFLIDDGSSSPLSRQGLEQNVWIWQPKCGMFRYSKAFWMEILLRKYADGCWAVTADSDEYLVLPQPPNLPKTKTSGRKSQIGQAVELALDRGLRYFTGFLLDLVPGPGSLATLQSNAPLKPADFSRYQFRPLGAPPAYRQHNTAKWSYGKYADWAYRIDVRFRLNRAYDSLRKFPLFRMGPDIHLNQGFHDLIIGGVKRTAEDLGRPDLLPILHYKLLGTQYDAEVDDSRPTGVYHHETRVNLDRLRRNLTPALRSAALSPFTFTFLDYALIPTPGRYRIKIYLADTESTENKYGSALDRESAVPVRVTKSGTYFQNGSIFAPTIDSAVGWLVGETPFNQVVEVSSQHAILQVREN